MLVLHKETLTTPLRLSAYRSKRLSRHGRSRKTARFGLRRTPLSAETPTFEKELRRGLVVLSCSLAAFLAGCAGVIPSSGPSAAAVHNTRAATGIQIVDLSEPVVTSLLARHTPQTFSQRFRNKAETRTTLGPGDVVEVLVLEAPPASLFGGGAAESGNAAARAFTFPNQTVSSAGTISIPFAGDIQAAGRTLAQVQADIAARLEQKANQPQVVVGLVENNTNYVTVLGAVSAATRMPLTARRERLLDAVAKAGGTSAEVNKLTVQVTRGGTCLAVPMETIIRDQRQNIVLQPGDVITVLHQPYSFIVLGATGRNEEIQFESPSIDLAQALARSGGLNDARSHLRGVFVFRFESPDALDWPRKPVLLTPQGKVPVVYCLDLTQTACFFLAKSFPICDGDIIYAANAPAAEIQKFLSLVGSIAAPGFSATAGAASFRN